MAWFRMQFIARNVRAAVFFHVGLMQTFQRDEKYSWLQHFRVVNICHYYIGKSAVKLAFHGADTDTDIDISDATIV